MIQDKTEMREMLMEHPRIERFFDKDRVSGTDLLRINATDDIEMFIDTVIKLSKPTKPMKKLMIIAIGISLVGCTNITNDHRILEIQKCYDAGMGAKEVQTGIIEYYLGETSKIICTP